MADYRARLTELLNAGLKADIGRREAAKMQGVGSEQESAAFDRVLSADTELAVFRCTRGVASPS